MPDKPSAFELFCLYYLGLTPEFEARFFNLHALARRYNASGDQVQSWLDEFRMTPDIFNRIKFNVAKAHGEAQVLSITGQIQEAEAFSVDAFKQFLEALKTYKQDAYYEDVDYNDIWGDKQE